MKRLLCRWAPAALICAVVVPGCAENNESAVTGNKGTTKIEATATDPPPQTQADLAKQYQKKQASPYAGEAYPGAAKNTAKAAPK